MLESAATVRESSNDSSSLLSGKRIAFLGKLGGMNRREAIAFAKLHGGTPVDRKHSEIDLIIIGADELPLHDDDLMTESMRTRYEAGQLEIIHETSLWESVGLIPEEGAVRKLYTPAMLADLLDVPIAVIRRWHRRGLIVPVREVHRLAYFDFQEVATARHLAKLLQAGATPAAIENKLAQLARWLPHVDRPLAQLSVITEGRDLLLRQGEGLVDASGQRRFDFEAASPTGSAGSTGSADQNADTGDGQSNVSFIDGAKDAESDSIGNGNIGNGDLIRADQSHDQDGSDVPGIVPIHQFNREAEPNPVNKSDLLKQAADMEEQGLLEEAVDAYRTALALTGPDATVNFEMAELLYRLGDISAARERYYVTLELDEDFVEARANLGCVLAETGQLDLAVAAFQGALVRHDGYPDVHYQLGRTLDELGRVDEALDHWRHFVALAPDSPWATEARDRLGMETVSFDDELDSYVDDGYENGESGE